MATQKTERVASSIMHCDICLEDKYVAAAAYCTVCKQYLCQPCRTFHERVSVTKFHPLRTGDALFEATASYSDSLECGSAPEEKTKCPEHRENDADYFCEAHDVPCCEKCKRIDHRNCSLESVSEIARKPEVQVANNATLANTKDILDEVEKLIQMNEQEMEAFTEEKDGFVEAVALQRGMINEVVEKWEHDLLETIDKFFQEKSTQTNDHIVAFSDIVSTTETMVRKLESAIQSKDDEALVFASTARKDVKKFKDMLSEVQREKFKTKLNLDTKALSRKLSDSFEHTVTLNVTKQLDGKAAERVYPDEFPRRNRQYRDRIAVEDGNILVQSPTDQETPGITGVEMLPDGRTIMCDAFNSKLKLFDVKFSLVSEKDLSSQPGRIDLTSVLGEVVISLPKERCLQTANVDSAGIALGNRIELDGKSHCVHGLDDKFIVKDNSSADSLVFHIIDRSGQCTKSLHVSATPQGFCAGNFTYTSMDASRSNFYIVNGVGGCLGFSATTGDVVFHFKETQEDFAYKYSGVTTDPDGNVYVGEPTTGEIVRVDESGRKIDVLITDIKDVRFIKYISSQNILFVKQRATNVVKTFQLL